MPPIKRRLPASVSARAGACRVARWTTPRLGLSGTLLGRRGGRIKAEARELLGETDGRLDVEKLLTLGAAPDRPALSDELLDI